MPNDDKEQKPRTVRTRPANVIRAIVLGAAAAAAPAALSGCPGQSDYGAPLPDATEDDAGDGDVSSEDAAPTDDGTTADFVPPIDGVEYGVPDGVEPDIPDGTEDGREAGPVYGIPDGMEEVTPDYGVPDARPDSVEDYGAPEYGAPDYGVPGDAGEPEYGLDYGVPKPPAK
mgnify:CR=1 FL=1